MGDPTCDDLDEGCPPLDDHYDPHDPAAGWEPAPDPATVARDDAVAAWFAVTAAAVRTGMESRPAAELLAQLTGAEPIYAVIGARSRELQRTLAALNGVLADIVDGPVWLDDLGLLASGRTDRQIRGILERVTLTLPSERPESRLAGAVANCRRLLSRASALALVEAIDSGGTNAELSAIFAGIVPPGSVGGRTATSDNPSVEELFASEGDQHGILTLSSGFPTLDIALHTRKHLPRGFVRGGQLVVLVAPSGAGKTSEIGTNLVAMTTDSLRQGHRGRLMFVHNEDDTTDLFAEWGIAPGKRFAHLAEHVTAMRTTSRTEFVKFFYREILRAKKLGVETGLGPRPFAPGAVVVDYYQALTEAGENEVQSTSTSADLLLYGVANCDPVALKQFSGLGFQEYTGEAWPAQLAGYVIPVVCTAQLLLKGNQKPFDPEKCNWRDYATANADDTPAWPVRPGDYPLSKLDDIRGATKIIQHATTIVGLHRSRPRNNPVAGVDARGFEQLQDNRGYFTILKARYGQTRLVLPMEFNRQRNGGSKAQYIDGAAEAAIASETVTFPYDDELWRSSGDPIIPVRPRRSRMRDVQYV